MLAFALTLICSSLVNSAASAAAPITPTIEIAPGVEMFRVSLGTCCGSQPKAGLAPWLAAGGRGIDTAYDYVSMLAPARVSDHVFISIRRRPVFSERSDFHESPYDGC